MLHICNAGTTRNSHDARNLARAIHNPETNFSQLALGKNYLVNSSFAHRPGYIAPYKGLDILYNFQQFYDEGIDHRRNFQNAREKFNFRHLSCRNVIECAFGVWKSHWKILDCILSYAFEVQTVIVIATIDIYNFFRQAGVVDKVFMRVETDLDTVKLELLNAHDEASVEMNAPKTQRDEWDIFRDYLTQQH